MKHWIMMACLLGMAGPMMFAESSALPEIIPVKAWRSSKAPAGREKIFAPVLKDNSIQFGNKTVLMNPDGRISCTTPENGLIFNGRIYFHLKEKGKTIWLWQGRNFDSGKSRFRREGNKYIWELWYREMGKAAFKGADQILEVLPDGQLSVSFRYTLPKSTPERSFWAWTLPVSMPENVWNGSKVILNGKSFPLGRGMKALTCPGKPQREEWIFGADDPAKKFIVRLDTKEIGNAQLVYRNDTKEYQFRFGSPKGKPEFMHAVLDFRHGVENGARDIRGGVDFKAQENMVLPDAGRKNLIENSSFERGLEGWHSPFAPFDGNYWDSLQEKVKPFVLDDSTAYDGRYSLRISIRDGGDYPTLNPNAAPLTVVAEPGEYTLSFYARGESDRPVMLHAWIPNFHRIDKDFRKWNFPVSGTQWKRYQTTFTVRPGAPVLFICFYGRNKEKTGTVWLDAVQLEKGKKMTAYQRPPAEGRLITAEPDNFLSSKEKINGKLRIITAKPDMEGTVRVTVKNFFGENLLDIKRDFRTGKDRTTDVALPLDDLPGLGVFVMRTDYALKDGSKAYDLRRYARIEYQTGPRPNRTLFGEDYNNTARNWNFLAVLRRWQKLGIGAKHHVGTRRKEVWDTYAKYGIATYNASMLSYMRSGGGNPRVKHFFILGSPNVPLTVTDKNDPRILIRDFYLDSNGTITPKYLAKMKEAVRTLAARYPHIKLWGLGGEMFCKMPNEWWGKNTTDQEAAHKLALLLKAFAEGVRAGNPEAKIYQDDPPGMGPRTGIAETDRVLTECGKLGVKFDLIAIHTYRYSPENPDTDADARTFLDMLEKHGYGKTDVLWPEGMHWGPFDIPQWGTRSSSWFDDPVTWRGTLSYDMGWTERKSAAWYARAWLVMLKYSDRVKGATAGNTKNNCYMDFLLTPYAAQLMPNTLCAILGDAKFKKDIRFAPYIRTYVFEDAQRRPVAAVWCHKEEIDDGREDAPTAQADFGGSLEAVFDLMNSPRAFVPGKMKFPVSSFPLFFRGRPGTLKQMIAAFENAQLVSGTSIPLLAVHVNPVSAARAGITVRNQVSREFTGKFNGEPIRIPSAGEIFRETGFARPLRSDAIVREDISVKIQSDTGSQYNGSSTLEAFTVKRVSDQATVDTLDWKKLPAIPFVRKTGPKTPISGAFRIGWNRFGLFIEAVIRDPKFVHVEYPVAHDRWKNDCLQIYFDTLANARQRTRRGYDEDDYDYAVFPNSKGDSAQVYRYRTVDSQLGLATQAPKDDTFAPDMPCRFSYKGGVLTYRVFFPAKYLLPIKLQKNCIFGFSLYAANSDEPGKTNGALSLDLEGKGCYERPHAWPVALLVE